jgi:hypothetical protein
MQPKKEQMKFKIVTKEEKRKKTKRRNCKTRQLLKLKNKVEKGERKY